jgi:hypothetical protein
LGACPRSPRLRGGTSQGDVRGHKGRDYNRHRDGALRGSYSLIAAPLPRPDAKKPKKHRPFAVSTRWEYRHASCLTNDTTSV